MYFIAQEACRNHSFWSRCFWLFGFPRLRGHRRTRTLPLGVSTMIRPDIAGNCDFPGFVGRTIFDNEPSEDDCKHLGDEGWQVQRFTGAQSNKEASDRCGHGLPTFLEPLFHRQAVGVAVVVMPTE